MAGQLLLRASERAGDGQGRKLFCQGGLGKLIPTCCPSGWLAVKLTIKVVVDTPKVARDLRVSAVSVSLLSQPSVGRNRERRKTSFRVMFPHTGQGIPARKGGMTRLGRRHLGRACIWYLVSGIWFIAQAQSFIQFSKGVVLRARGAPVPLRVVLVIVLRA